MQLGCSMPTRDADETGKRPWLRTLQTLNAAVAWMIRHEAEIRRLIARSDPEPPEN
jgi:hypothetical protein